MMLDRLLIGTDLDRTLIPNGPQPESPGARKRFAALAARSEVTLAYVSGRHRALVEAAIAEYDLPQPDFVIGDVGTTIYVLDGNGGWRRERGWAQQIAQDWAGTTHADLAARLGVLPDLRLQEDEKQNDYKLSYYVPLAVRPETLCEEIQNRLAGTAVKARLIWSVDELEEVRLLDVVPYRASKYHAVEALMAARGWDYTNTVFSGDSGNDLEVLASPIPSVLVANCEPAVRDLARRRANDAGWGTRLYVAQGNFMGMNGCYAAGILEGIAHYHPETAAWMRTDGAEERGRA